MSASETTHTSAYETVLNRLTIFILFTIYIRRHCLDRILTARSSKLACFLFFYVYFINEILVLSAAIS
jgi:phage-related holin